jgi:hypothetical protein
MSQDNLSDRQQDGQLEFNSQQGYGDFISPSHPGLVRFTQPSIQVNSGRSINLTTHLVLKLRLHGTLPSLQHLSLWNDA